MLEPYKDNRDKSRKFQHSSMPKPGSNMPKIHKHNRDYKAKGGININILLVYL